jgi:hypothetical protein
MTKIWTRETNTGKWELYGEVRHEEVTYHCRKIREMAPGAYIKVGR